MTMRNGRWTKGVEFGEGSAEAPGFPAMPGWFGGNADMPRLAEGLRAVGFSPDEVGALMGGNWARFFEAGFGPAVPGPSPVTAAGAG